MPEPVSQAWLDIQESMSMADHPSVVALLFYLAIGGVMALYIRFLYGRYSRSAVSADSVARVFPLLTLVTTAVIAVVKSSLALSLGLVGALSIVRFRAAIKDPEELVYLFLCIAVGLSLGAEQPLVAVSLVAIATLYIVLFQRFRGGGDDVVLTVSGDAERFFLKPEAGVIAVIDDLCPNAIVQRCDVEDGEGQVRVILHAMRADAVFGLVSKLRARLPGCRISYTNLGSVQV